MEESGEGEEEEEEEEEGDGDVQRDLRLTNIQELSTPPDASHHAGATETGVLAEKKNPKKPRDKSKTRQVPETSSPRAARDRGSVLHQHRSNSFTRLLKPCSTSPLRVCALTGIIYFLFEGALRKSVIVALSSPSGETPLHP